MNIGIPKERRPSEFRVGLTPAGVELLTREGHGCYIERGAGVGAGFQDDSYRAAGGRIVYSGEEVYGRADLVLKVARPTDEELDWLVPMQTLMAYLYLPSARPEKLQALLDKSITAIAYEAIRLPDGSLPALRPLSQIGGRMAAQIAATLSQNGHGGRGVLLGGVAGVPPAEAVILGAGVVGENAARAFLGMGAQVTLLDRDLDRLQQLEDALPGRIVTLVSHPFNLERVCRYADVLVGAVHQPGGRAPVLITRTMIASMRPGAVFIDLSIDEGGCAETSRPTTHASPVYVEEGVLHCCIPNLPGVVARTATHAFLNAAWPYIQQVAALGPDAAIAADPVLRTGVAAHRGTVLS
ncbi:MAG TPA: alanine dehydrogenase [Anaerolineales bacterium]|nr:alanine dehydrogenase [Anaerolineales bacterium]